MLTFSTLQDEFLFLPYLKYQRVHFMTKESLTLIIICLMKRSRFQTASIFSDIKFQGKGYA